MPKSLTYGIHLYPDADGEIVAQNTVVGNGNVDVNGTNHGGGIIVAGEGTQTSDNNRIVNNISAELPPSSLVDSSQFLPSSLVVNPLSTQLDSSA